MQISTISQRADYTHKFNKHAGRHGWLRLTPAYSVKVVEEILENAPHHSRVLDPFSGTATTPLCASYRNYRATSLDINPFLIWLGKAKTDIYDSHTVSAARLFASTIVQSLSSRGLGQSAIPPIHDIERWWRQPELDFLCALKSSIELHLPVSSPEKNLLLIVFCRLLIKLSNAAFNHQSMSFKDTRSNQLELLSATPSFERLFLSELETVLNSAEQNPTAKAEIMYGDARNADGYLSGRYDLLITSPPYPNRMSYIRELRPYMYWLGYLKAAREAGELDWEAIGGTWGIATSRLSEWEKGIDGYYPAYLDCLLKDIASSANKNGRLMANYIAKYFEDIWKHLQSVIKVMSHGGKVHYIVGNSTFYDTLLPVEKIYKEMLEALGFHHVRIKTIRKRNSKKALFEYDVSGVRN